MNHFIWIAQKQKVQRDSVQVEKVIRHFPQTKPIAADAKQSKPELTDDFLDAVSINFIIDSLISFCSCSVVIFYFINMYMCKFIRF